MDGAADFGFECFGRYDSQLGCEIHGLRGYTAGMSSGVSVDEFQALEQKVLRAVEIVKREREARTTAEAEVAALREQLAALSNERDGVRQRVEKMLAQMDELV